MIGIGTVFAIGSFSFLQLEQDYGDGEKTKTWNGAAFIGGVAIGIGGYWMARWIAPDREDYLDFINKHNANTDREPLKLNLGWDFDMSQPTILARLTF